LDGNPLLDPAWCAGLLNVAPAGLNVTLFKPLLKSACGFKIRQTRYNEIVVDMVNQEIREDENLAF